MIKTLVLTLRNVTALAGASIAAVALAIVAIASPDVVIERSFERAMKETGEALASPSRFAAGAPGSEDHWLRSPPADQRIVRASASPLTAGDRVTIRTRAGEKVLEVADVRQLGDDKLFFVSCRSADGSKDTLVRFVWDARRNLPTLAKADEQATL